MRKLNIVLIALTIMGVSYVHADCPPASEINKMGGEYGATGMNGAWSVRGAPSGMGIDTIRTAKLERVTGKGATTIVSGGEDRSCSTCSMLACAYKVNETAFVMIAPDGQYKPNGVIWDKDNKDKGKPEGAIWSRVKDNKSYNASIYECVSATGSVGDCPFSKFPQ